MKCSTRTRLLLIVSLSFAAMVVCAAQAPSKAPGDTPNLPGHVDQADIDNRLLSHNHRSGSVGGEGENTGDEDL